MGNLKCGISQKRLVLQRNGCLLPWVWFGVIRCNLQNFRFHDFRNTTPSTLFIRFQPNFIQSIIIRGKYSYYFLPKRLKTYGTLMTFFLNPGPYGAGNFKTLLLLQFSSELSAKLYEEITYHGGIKAITFLGNQPSFKNFLALWNFKMRVNGKPEMCNIPKMANRRVKRTQIWDSGATMNICRVLLMPDSLSLVWVHLVHFAKFPILQFSKTTCMFLSQFSSDSSKAYRKYHNHTGCPAKIMALWILS